MQLPSAFLWTADCADPEVFVVLVAGDGEVLALVGSLLEGVGVAGQGDAVAPAPVPEGVGQTLASGLVGKDVPEGTLLVAPGVGTAGAVQAVAAIMVSPRPRMRSLKRVVISP